MQAGLSQLSAARSSIAVVAVIVVAIAGTDVDTSGPDLDVNLREG
jgi:hypothetical protein